MSRHVEVIVGARGLAFLETYTNGRLTAISQAYPTAVARARAASTRLPVIDHTAVQ